MNSDPQSSKLPGRIIFKYRSHSMFSIVTGYGHILNRSFLAFVGHFPQILEHQSLSIHVFVAQSYLTLCNPMDYRPMEFSRPEYWSGWPFPSPGDLPNPGIKSRSPALQANSLPAKPQGKHKNTGVGSLSFP